MKRENLEKARKIISMLEHLEQVRDAVHFAKQNKFLGYTGVTIKIGEDLEYMFPDSVEFSMFHSIISSSLETEIEKYNKHLEEL